MFALLLSLVSNVKLKVDSHTPFYLARIVNRACDLAEILLLVQPQIIRAGIARIGWLKVVKDARELHCELQPNAFGNLNILGESCVVRSKRQLSVCREILRRESESQTGQLI